MTLVAGFRCADGGVLLGADRERSDQFGKRSVEKLFRILTKQGTFLVAGSGRASIVDNALMRLDIALKAAADKNDVVLFDKHREVIETVLYEIHEEYIWGNRDEHNRGVGFIIAASFRSPIRHRSCIARMRKFLCRSSYTDVLESGKTLRITLPTNYITIISPEKGQRFWPLLFSEKSANLYLVWD
jgi:hypothetical protein